MEHLASRRISCPLPVKDREGHALKELAGRPAALITFLDGLWVRRPEYRALRGAWRCARPFPSRRRRLPDVQSEQPVAAGLARAVRGDRRRRRQDQARAFRRDREGAASSGRALARQPAARRDPCRPVPRQCVLPRRQGLGAHRFLFRLQRHARLRRRGLPQCLVLRVRRQLQRHQGARAVAGL